MSISKVTVDYIGIPHYYAVCENCEWKYEDYRDRRKGQREIRKHVLSTGHTVMLEKAVSVHYSPRRNLTSHCTGLANARIVNNGAPS